MTMLHRGEIWQYRFKAPDKRRPVIILTRQEVLPLLRTAMVAPITSTIRGLPSEVAVGADEGLARDSAINLVTSRRSNSGFCIATSAP